MSTSILALEEHNAYRFFINSIRSEATRSKYVFYFKKYLEYVKCFDADVLLQKSPREIETELIEFIIKMKGENKNYYAIQNYITAAVAFYKINDVILNKNKISKFMPEQKIRSKDRAYTHEEIKSLLDIADERLSVVILLLASTGMRIGAIPYLRKGNLEKLNDYDNIYKIIVYENSNEHSICFCTPECSKVIDSYMDMRRRYGETITDKSALVREQYDVRDPFAISNPKKITSEALARKLVDLAERAGIRARGVIDDDEKDKVKSGSLRKDVAIAHGFRKFWTTQAGNAKMNPEIREMLLGHSIQLMNAYYRPSPDEMLQEYVKIVDDLTIEPSNRLQRKIEKLEVEKTEFDRLRADIELIKHQIKK